MKSRYDLNKLNSIYNNRKKTRYGITKAIGEINDDSLKDLIAMRYTFDNNLKRNYLEFTKDMTLIMSNKEAKTVKKYAVNESAENTLRKMVPLFNELTDIKLLTSKESSSKELMHKTIAIDNLNVSMTNARINTSKKDMLNTYDKFKKAKYFNVYDSETLSGRNSNGAQELDNIQEIALKRYERVGDTVKEVEEDRIETLVGISHEQANRYRKELVDNFETGGFGGTEKNKVLADRFAKLGHADTSIEHLENGIARIKTFASDDSKDLMSLENIENGIRILEELGRKQDIERTAIGLKTHEEMIFDVIHRLNNEVTVGYNSVNFDTNMFNREAAKIWGGITPNQKQAIAKKYDWNVNEIPTAKTAGNQLDLFDFVKFNSSLDGKTDLFGMEDIEKLYEKGLSPQKQESFAHIFAPKRMNDGAHAAVNDVDALSDLVVGENSLLARLASNIKKSTDLSTDVGVGSLMMVTNPTNYNEVATDGGLGFIHDGYSNSIRTTNGYEISSKGVSYVDQYGKGIAPRKGSIYEISHIGEMDMTDEWSKIARESFPEYSGGKLYGITYTPAIDKSIANGNEILAQPYTRLFTSIEQMQGSLSSSMAHIGENTPNGPVALSGEIGKAIVDNFGITTLGEDGISTKSFNIDEAITLGTKKLKNNSASRFVSNMEYTKVKNFNALQDYFNSRNISKVEDQIKLLASITSLDPKKRNEEVAKEVTNILGYYKNGAKTKTLLTSTLNNFINSYEYLSSIRPISEKAIEFAENQPMQTGQGKQVAFKTMMDNALGLANEQGENPEDAIELFNHEANYFEFDLGKGHFKPRDNKVMKDDIDSVIRINLNTGSEYSLVNTLVKRAKDDERISSNAMPRNIYGRHEVERLIEAVNKSEDFLGDFNDMVRIDPFVQKQLEVLKMHELDIDRAKKYKATFAHFDDIKANIYNHADVKKARDEFNEISTLRDRAIKETQENPKNELNKIYKKLDKYNAEWNKAEQDFSEGTISEYKFNEIKNNLKTLQADGSSELKDIKEKIARYAVGENEHEDKYIEAAHNYTRAIELAKGSTEEEANKKILSITDKYNLMKSSAKKEIANIGIDDEKTIRNTDMSADTLAEMFISRLKKLKKTNPEKFKLNGKSALDVSKPYKNIDLVNENLINKAREMSENMLPKVHIVKNAEESLEQSAERITNDVLMPKVKLENGKITSNVDDIAKHAAELYGFNKDTEKILKATLEEHRAMHKEGVKSLIEGIHSAGGILAYGENKELGFIVNNEYHSLHAIPRTEMRNGILFHQMGTQRFSAGIKFSSKKKAIVSNLEDYYNELNGLSINVEKAIMQNNDPVGIVKRDVTRATTKARDISVLNRNTTKDIQSFNKLNDEEAILSIPDNLDKLRSYGMWQDDNFIEIMEKNADSIRDGNISSEVQEAFVKNKGDVMKTLIGTGAGQELTDRNNSEIFIAGLSNRGKKGTIVGGYDPVGLLSLDNHARPPAASADNIMYKEDYLKEEFKKNKLKGKVEIGSRMQSKMQSNGIEYEDAGKVIDHITVKNLNISDSNLKNIFAEHFDNMIASPSLSEKEKAELVRLKHSMNSLNISEQGKIIDGYLAKSMLSKTETKRIGTYKDFIDDLEINSEIMNRRAKNVMPVIDIAEDGAIQFKLGQLEHVKRGDSIFNFSEFGGGISTTISKEKDGFLGFKYFAKDTNIEVSSKDINKFLNNNKHKVKNKFDAMRLLDEKYDTGFTIENSFIKGYNKGTSELAEKGMYSAMLSGAGTIKTEVKDALSEMGLEEAHGQIIGNTYLDNVIKDKFHSLSKSQKDKIGFKTWDHLKSTILDEQMAMSDEFEKMFGDITTVSLDNVAKHKNLGYATKHFLHNVASSLRDRDGLNLDESYQAAAKLANEYNIINNYEIKANNGKLLFDELDDSNYMIKSNVEKLSRDLGIYEETNKNNIYKDGKLIGRTTKSSLAFNEDFSGTSKSSKDIDRVREKINETHSAIKNAIINNEDTSPLVEQKKNLEANLRGLLDSDKEMKITSRETNMLGLTRYSDRTMNNVRKNLGDEHYNKIFRRMLSDENGSINEEYKGKRINESFIKDIEDKAKKNAIENSESVHGNYRAVNFNNGHVNKEFLESKGFVNMDVNDMVTSHGEDNIFLKDVANGTHGKNIVISTGLSDDGYSHIAISSIDSKISGNSLANDEVQKHLKKVIDSKARYDKAIAGDVAVLSKGATVESVRETYKKSLNNLKEAQAQKFKDSVSELGEVKLSGYSYEKADMANLHLDDIKDGKFKLNKSYEMYDVSKINGRTVGEWAADGIHYDASWHGVDHFENLGYFDKKMLNKYNFTREQMIDHLKTNGTMHIETRTPTIMQGSTSMVHTFLDDNLSQGKSKGTAPLIIGRNQDHDGDSIIHAEISHNGFTMSDYHSGIEMPDESKKYFDELEASTTVKASTINHNIFNKKIIGENGLISKENNMVESSTNINEVMEASTNSGIGHIGAYRQTEMDSYKRNIHLQRYEELKGMTKHLLGDEYDESNPKILSRLLNEQVEIMPKENRQIYKDSIRQVETYHKDMAAAQAKKAGKVSIGFINTPLYRARLFAEGEGFGEEAVQMINASNNILEESIISSKHGKEYAISLTGKFRRAFQDMTNGKDEGLSTLKSLMIDRHGSEIADAIRTTTTLGLEEASDEDILSTLSSHLDTMGDIFKHDRNAKPRWLATDIGRTFNEKNGRDLVSEVNPTNSSLAGKALAAIGIDGSSPVTKPRARDFEFNSEHYVSSIRHGIDEAVESVTHSAGGKGLAMKALALAGAVMATGYIGGNPATPATNQAEQQANDNQYESLQDKDLNIQSVGQASGPQGYVININAQSTRGRDNAMAAIQQAIQKSTPTNINMQMNINDKASNINSRYIQNLMAGTL